MSIIFVIKQEIDWKLSKDLKKCIEKYLLKSKSYKNAKNISNNFADGKLCT